MDFFTALKQNINEYIVANGNKEITADILRPILLEICNITFDKMGDLELLQTVYKDDLVGAINEALNAESGVKIHYGTFPNPNDAEIPNFELGDFYAQQGDTGIDSFWQYNGQKWIRIADSGGGDTGSSRQKTVIRQLDYNQMDFELTENQMIAEAINTSGPHTCAEDERMLFAVSYVTGGGRAQSVLTKYYRVHQNRTAYGIGHAPIGSAHISPAGEQSTKVRLIDLELIGSIPVENVFNQGDNGSPWVISGETYVKAETLSGEKLWKFIGGDGLWGAGSQTATAGDFLLQSEEAQIPTGFITKTSHLWNKVLVSSETGFTLPYNSEKRAYNFVKGGVFVNKANFEGFNISGFQYEFEYDGIEIVLRNHDLSTSVSLRHNSSTADIPFLFSDATDVELAPKEIATFKYYNGAFHLVSRSKPAGSGGGGNAVWGSITGDIEDQTDLMGKFNEKQDVIGFTPEDVENKSTSLTDPNDTNYPTTKAVADAVKNKHLIKTSSFTVLPEHNNHAIFCNATDIVVTIDASKNYPKAFEVFFVNRHQTLVTFVWTNMSGWTKDAVNDTLISKDSCGLFRVGDSNVLMLIGNSMDSEIIPDND